MPASRRGLSVVAIFALSCATATPINTGAERQSYLIECSGEANQMSSCIKKANSLCPRGYEIAGSSEAPQNTAAVFVNPNLGTVTAVQGVDRRLVITCR